MTKFMVVKDTREKKGWMFKEDADSCLGTTKLKLDTGDYSIKGFENSITIERKGSIVEFAQNIIQDRFERELMRMHNYPFSFVVLEFDMEDLIKYPHNCRFRRKPRTNGKFILKRLNEIQFEHPQTSILFCGKHGKQVTYSLFKRFIERVEKYI